MARAFAISLPRRTPPSTSTSMRPPTASITAGKTSSALGALSSWRPPWFDSTMPSTPWTSARSASATESIPLTHTLPRQWSRSHAIASHPRLMSIWRLSAAAWVAKFAGKPALFARFTNCGEPRCFSIRRHHLGCDTRSISNFELMRSGIRKPLRTSWSRLPCTAVSTVSISAVYPADSARRIRSCAIPRSCWT